MAYAETVRDVIGPDAERESVQGERYRELWDSLHEETVPDSERDSIAAELHALERVDQRTQVPFIRSLTNTIEGLLIPEVQKAVPYEEMAKAGGFLAKVFKGERDMSATEIAEQRRRHGGITAYGFLDGNADRLIEFSSLSRRQGNGQAEHYGLFHNYLPTVLIEDIASGKPVLLTGDGEGRALPVEIPKFEARHHLSNYVMHLADRVVWHSATITSPEEDARDMPMPKNITFHTTQAWVAQQETFFRNSPAFHGTEDQFLEAFEGGEALITGAIEA